VYLVRFQNFTVIFRTKLLVRFIYGLFQIIGILYYLDPRSKLRTGRLTCVHCCGSGSGIHCLFDRDPGWVRNQDPDTGWTFWVIFPRAFFGLKYLIYLMRIRIRDPGIFLTLDPGWKKFGSGINIPDPQHCRCTNCVLMMTPSPYTGDTSTSQPCQRARAGAPASSRPCR